MSSSIPPSGGPPPSVPPPPSDGAPSQPPFSPSIKGNAEESGFFKGFSKKQKEQFMNLVVQGITDQIKKETAKAIAALKKIRESIEGKNN